MSKAFAVRCGASADGDGGDLVVVPGRRVVVVARRAGSRGRGPGSRRSAGPVDRHERRDVELRPPIALRREGDPVVGLSVGGRRATSGDHFGQSFVSPGAARAGLAGRRVVRCRTGSACPPADGTTNTSACRSRCTTFPAAGDPRERDERVVGRERGVVLGVAGVGGAGQLAGRAARADRRTERCRDRSARARAARRP